MPSKRQSGIRKPAQGAAITVPLFCFALFGFASWVIVGLLVENHLFHPSNGDPTRHAAGVAIIVIYFILLTLLLAAYVRTLYTVQRDPGFVPLPDAQEVERLSQRPDAPSKNEHSGNSNKSSRSAAEHDSTNEKDAGRAEKEDDENDDKEDDRPHTALSKGYLDRGPVLDGEVEPPPGLEEFYTRNVFECDNDGLPKWCNSCKNWKPDRSHHSGEAGRCVYKLDHFCPWAGGIVCETNFKYFIQFCFYTGIWCLFNAITLIYFLAKKGETGTERVLWIVILALSALFFLFTTGMAVNSLHFAFINSTTVDNLGRNRSRFFAIHSAQLSALSEGDRRELNPDFSMVTYPLTSASSNPYQPRTFAILSNPRGKSPYKLPDPWNNFRQIMGRHWFQWFLPLGHSPSSNHGYASSTRDIEAAVGEARFMYLINHDVLEKMIKDASLNDISKIPKKEKKPKKSSHKKSQAAGKDGGDETDQASSSSNSVNSDDKDSSDEEETSSNEGSETEKPTAKTREAESQAINTSEQTLVPEKDDGVKETLPEANKVSNPTEPLGTVDKSLDPPDTNLPTHDKGPTSFIVEPPDGHGTVNGSETRSAEAFETAA